MALGTNNGNLTGTASSKFRVVCEIDVSDESDTQYRLRHRFYIQVTTGNFSGSHFTCSWRSSYVVVNGTGTYGSSGWIDDGWRSSGYKLSLSANAYYYGGSGTKYTSSVSCSYTVPQLQTIPNTPSSCTLGTNGTATWAFTTSSTKPVTDQQVQLETNDEWGSAKAISNGTTKSYAFGTLAENSRFRARVRTHNSSGWSGYRTSSYIYTDPIAPTASGQYIDNTYYLQCNNYSSVRYIDSLTWEQQNGDTWTEIANSDAAIISGSFGTNTSKNFRVKVSNSGGLESDYTTFTLSPIVRAYIQVPDGTDPANMEIYINKP